MTGNKGKTRECPRCGRGLDSGMAVCPKCGGVGSREEVLGQELVAVYEPPDQMAALTAASLLESQGIKATVRSEQIAMYDGLAMMMRPKWGKVLVLERDRQRALGILEDLMTEDTGGEEGGGD